MCPDSSAFASGGVKMIWFCSKPVCRNVLTAAYHRPKSTSQNTSYKHLFQPNHGKGYTLGIIVGDLNVSGFKRVCLRRGQNDMVLLKTGLSQRSNSGVSSPEVIILYQPSTTLRCMSHLYRTGSTELFPQKYRSTQLKTLFWNTPPPLTIPLNYSTCSILIGVLWIYH